MDRLLTPFGEKLQKKQPLKEYPRPQLERGSFLCLNGLWQYAITRQEGMPAAWDGEILVPFAPESVLSGVERVVQADDYLWYQRRFTLPSGFMQSRVLLHFGAVDQCCVVQLNGTEVGRHDGGYFPFSLDVTDALEPEAENTLTVMVIDESETAPYMRGPQRLAGGDGWLSPMSGIWQTVWMESVPEQYITSLAITPLYDERAVLFSVEANAPLEGEVEVIALSTVAAKGHFCSGEPLRLELPGALSWHPRNPFLYTVRIKAGQDSVSSYFGMRKFSVEPDEKGDPRLMLNNKPFFARGVVDQGYWPDGLYTPPGEEALKHDVRYAKRCGFNLIRKVGKIEPLRWYYHCDRTGIAVLQGLPGGEDNVKRSLIQRLFGRKDDTKYKAFGRESQEGRDSFLRDADRAIELLQGIPCLAGWVLFEGGYGQFDSKQLAQHVGGKDPAHWVVAASGGCDMGGGQALSVHQLGEAPVLPQAAPDDTRARLLGACGGFSQPVEEASTPAGDTPLRIRPPTELQKQQAALWLTLISLEKQGLAGFCYTQLSDCDSQQNGLQSADRRKSKTEAGWLEKRNEALP